MKWLLLFYCTLYGATNHVVTHEAGGRFGDQLLSYLHAKWLSYHYDVPLRYQPFHCSPRLVLDDREALLDKDPDKESRITLRLTDTEADFQKTEAATYICPFFPENPFELNRRPWYHFDADWKNPEFRKIVLELVAPKSPLELIVPPKHTINIAIHVRDGGGYDPASTKLANPVKLPPMSFYIEALRKITPLFPGKAIHCQVFTDAPEPQEVVRILERELPSNASIRFTKGKKCRPDSNMLRDFFSLFNFDILIRPQSNFSIIPSLIHDYAIVYSPTDAVIEGNQVTICKADMEINEDLYQKMLLKKKPWWRLFW